MSVWVASGDKDIMAYVFLCDVMVQFWKGGVCFIMLWGTFHLFGVIMGCFGVDAYSLHSRPLASLYKAGIAKGKK